MGKETLEEIATWLMKLHINNSEKLYYEFYNCQSALELKEAVESCIDLDVWALLKEDIINHALNAVDWHAVIYDTYGVDE